VAAFALVSSGCISAWRRVRTWRARLRRKRAMLALAIVLLLGLGEPLACIIHCQIWLPFVSHMYFAAQLHHHHHHMSSGSSATAQPSALAYSDARAPSPNTPAPICELHGSQSDGVPFHIPPSPVHEMLPVCGLPIVLVILLLVNLITSPETSPNRCVPPLLRPPIAFAV